MRVLFIGLDIYDRIGGIQRFNQRVIRALSELQEEVVALSLWDMGETTAIAPSGVTFVPCRRSKVKFVLRFLAELATFRPDCILCGHVSLFPLALLGRVFRPRASRLLIVHGIEVWGTGYRHISRLERLVVTRVFHAVISVSRFTEQKMRLSYGFRAPSYLLPNAIDLRDRPASSLPPAGPYAILTVTRLWASERDKGVDKVLHALPAVLNVIPEVTYTVIGEGPLKRELQELACELGVDQSVRFLGYVDDATLDKCYEESRIFILPSSKEGFGIVFLEAWQHHLPVICGDRDAGAEVVTNNLNGLTITPDSHDEIVEAILYMLMNPQIAQRMGNEGYNTLVRNYSHSHFVRSLEHILHDATGLATRRQRG